MRAALFSKLEFWQQLVIFFSAGMVILGFCTSIVLTITANNSLKSQLIGQSLYLTESLGRQARLSLLYESPEEAGDIVNIALQYPDVVGINIRTDKGMILRQDGTLPFTGNTNFSPDETVLAEELEEYLIFVSPVRTEVENDMVLHDEGAAPEASSEIIGYITIAISTSSLDQIWTQLLESNLLVSTLVAIPLLILLLILTRRLTTPLRSLSSVMGRAENGELNLRASLSGPKDIEDMQKAFNTMMASLEKQTGELKVARDEALESAKIKSEFAANVSHELRTPMNSVLGMLDLLSVMGLSSQQQEYVETAKLSAQNLLGLIDDILSYVRLDTGKMVLEHGACDLGELVEDVVVLMSTQALKKRLDIGYLLKTQNLQIMVDRQRLRHTLINLVGNAVKFTESGEVSVKVDLIDDAKPKLEFCVEDTGIGIGKEAQEKIFDVFTQEDSTTTRKYGGTGLGLAICRQFVTLLGGEIRVESEKGKGSRFIFTIPVEVLYKKPQYPEKYRFLQDKRVVIMDDSAIVREFLAQWFSRHHADVHVFSSLEEVFDFLNKLDGESQLIDYLFIDEEVLGIKFDEILGFLLEHPCCSELSETVCLVNPWNISHYKSTTDYSILEKPLFDARIEELFARSRRQQKPAGPGLLRKHTSYLDAMDLRLLVAEDNQANCLVAKGMLEQLGCTIEVAFNGRDAVELARRAHFDAILMDCNMPVMDGYEATRQIRELPSDISSLPIIAMTANNSVEEKNRCINAGMDDFIAKPLSIAALRESLEKWSGKMLAPESEPRVGEDGMVSDETLGIDKIEELKNSVGDIFSSVVEAFLEDTPAYLRSLKSAIQEGDTQLIFELSHSIKGSAATFGGAAVAELAKQLEARGKENNMTGVEGIFEELEARAEEMLTSLRNYTHTSTKLDLSTPRTEEASILVADDDRAIRMAFSNALGEKGYNIVEVANGQSALAHCSRAMPDLIILDAIMPEVDGFAACRKIRTMAKGADVPILVVTSLEDDESISKAFRAGATDYVPKPINISVLCQRVARLLHTSRAERHVRRLAYHDVLTGLPNRAYFNQQLRQKISRADLKKQSLAILFLDMDRFKVINDSLGHDAGDLILKEAADRISECVTGRDVVARLGGDEFTVILDDGDIEAITEVSMMIVRALKRPFEVMDQRLFLSVSIGVSVYPRDGESASELLKHADNAMYKAKESGESYCFYHEGMEDEVLERLEVERDIRAAIAEDQFFLVYQAQFDFESREISRVEALVRWRHPSRGVLTAGAFIPFIEDTGLIAELGKLVYQKACQDLERCYRQGVELQMAINVSGGELQDGKLRNQLNTLLNEYDFPAHMLEIEITESILMDNPSLVEKELSILRQQGISIAIDDFGSGFSSLSYLKNFSVDIVKIDREFVKDCHTNQNDRAIISGIIALAKTLKLKVVAEGIEVQEQYDFLKSTGCDFAQGYLLCREMPLDELLATVEAIN